MSLHDELAEDKGEDEVKEGKEERDASRKDNNSESKIHRLVARRPINVTKLALGLLKVASNAHCSILNKKPRRALFIVYPWSFASQAPVQS